MWEPRSPLTTPELCSIRGLSRLWTPRVLIWPNQKKILGVVQATDEEKARARRLAFLASRANTMLSIPLLFFVTASGGLHIGIFA